jgi:hypothetical protein
MTPPPSCLNGRCPAGRRRADAARLRRRADRDPRLRPHRAGPAAGPVPRAGALVAGSEAEDECTGWPRERSASTFGACGEDSGIAEEVVDRRGLPQPRCRSGRRPTWSYRATIARAGRPQLCARHRQLPAAGERAETGPARRRSPCPTCWPVGRRRRSSGNRRRNPRQLCSSRSLPLSTKTGTSRSETQTRHPPSCGRR